MANLLPAIFGGNDDYQQASPNAQAMSREELAEAQRIAALNKQMQGIFQGRYDNAAGNAEALDLKKIFGGEYAGLAGEMLPGRFQQDALAGLMGLTGNVGGGTVNAEANRGFLNDQANTEAAGGAVNTLVNELLDFADQRMAGGEQPVAAQPAAQSPGVTVTPQGPVLPGSF